VRRLAILGSTGSIGRSALDVARTHADRLSVVALAAGENATRLAEQVRAFRPEVVGVATEAAREELHRCLGPDAAGLTIEVGRDGLVAAATHPDVDVVLCATSGTACL
jgi:1-deoxy-D-xylulose-5-phosphate reductoisomerase